jgi:c-di-GMP-binding flagellar brake protein YcgR
LTIAIIYGNIVLYKKICFHIIKVLKKEGIEMIEIMDERRKYPRVSVKVPVQYKNIKTLSEPLVGALTRDMGEGGIRFIGNEFLSLANRLVITVALPAPQRSVKIISKVAWIRKVPMGDQYEVGGQFLSMSDEDKQELKSFLVKPQSTP